MDFLGKMINIDVQIGLDAKVTLELPLEKWSMGLFRNLDMTLGSASFNLIKAKKTMGLYGNIVRGPSDGGASTVSDLQTKILEKFNTPEVKAVLELAGIENGIAGVVGPVAKLVAMRFDFFFRATCDGKGNGDMGGMPAPPAWAEQPINLAKKACHSIEFGIKLDNAVFNAYIEYISDSLAICFKIKAAREFDLCGSGGDILALLSKIGDAIEAFVVDSIITPIGDTAEAIGDAATAATDETVNAAKHHWGNLCDGGAAVGKFGKDLAPGKLEVKAIEDAFVENAGKAAKHFQKTGNHVLKFSAKPGCCRKSRLLVYGVFG